ncbi:hypothetical protein ACIPMW_32185 [Streptomyces sp. NPDC086669]|uniref:hypothetical protein n=1 Tax=Streptomyces sp. NPDC086669 TaxID=3365753 RepID=UPI003801C80C
MSERLTPQQRPRTILDRARDCLNARMTKDDLLHVLQNVIAYAEHLERKVAGLKAEQDRDDAEYAAVIEERDRALETVAAMEGEHYATVHHDYRAGRDLPYTQTAEATS